MAKMTDEESSHIISALKEILRSKPKSFRTKEVLDKLENRFRKFTKRAIHRVVLDYASQASDVDHSSGWFRDPKLPENGGPPKPSVDEEKYYQPFAQWLIENECTNAIVVGHAKFKGSFGTPDVVGIIDPSKKGDVIPTFIEIVSAEIKGTTSDLMKAFGQACSYMLFSHKSYIVVPEHDSPDMDRLESLCLICQVGLVVFDAQSPPNFKIRARPRKHDPDMSYVNEKMKLIWKDLHEEVSLGLAAGA